MGSNETGSGTRIGSIYCPPGMAGIGSLGLEPPPIYLGRTQIGYMLVATSNVIVQIRNFSSFNIGPFSIGSADW